MKPIISRVAIGVAGLALVTTFVARAQDAPGGTTSVEVSKEGREVYEQICQACHMADGMGGGGAGASIPALAGNPNLAEPAFGVGILVKGRGGMPWFTDILTPGQMAAVLTYVRSELNTYPEPVTEADVQRVIAATEAPTPDCSSCR
ncbi:MAG: cytochrome c [Porphyrobacter sp.]|nr:cytochrome c [Porphyrobacter sp.]